MFLKYLSLLLKYLMNCENIIGAVGKGFPNQDFPTTKNKGGVQSLTKNNWLFIQAEKMFKESRLDN